MAALNWIGGHIDSGTPTWRDAPVLVDGHDDDCPTYQHAHVEQYTCAGCGHTALVEGEVNVLGEGVEYTGAGEWVATCPHCGDRYVLTSRP